MFEVAVVRRASRFAVAFSTMILLLAAISFSESSGKHVLHDGWRQVEQKPNQNVNGDRGGYVGSKVCAQCHAPIASKYSRNQALKVRYLVDDPLFRIDACQVKRGQRFHLRSDGLQIIALLKGRLEISHGETKLLLNAGEFAHVGFKGSRFVSNA